MDSDTILAVLSGVVGGALIGALATVGVSLLNQKHERNKWVREQRLALYLAISDANHEFTGNFHKVAAAAKEVNIPANERDFDVDESYALLEIIGPKAQHGLHSLHQFQAKSALLSSKSTARSYAAYWKRTSKALGIIRGVGNGEIPSELIRQYLDDQAEHWSTWEKHAKADLGIND